MQEEASLDIFELIKKYVKLIYKKRHFFIVISLIVMSPIVWGSFFLPDTYEASSLVFMEENVIKELVKGIAITPSLDERLKVLRQEMLSRNLITKVIKELDLDVQFPESSMEGLIRRIQNGIEIQYRQDYLTVSYKDQYPKVAQDVVNTIVNLYIEQSKISKKDESQEATEFLAEQIQYYKKKLDEADTVLTEFRKEKFEYITVSEGQLYASLQADQEQIDLVNISIKEFEAKKDKLQKQLDSEDPMTVAMVSKEGNPMLAQLESLEHELLSLSTKYTDKHPEVMKKKLEIESLKEKIKTAAKNPKGFSEGAETSYINPIYQQVKEKLFETESELESLYAKRKLLQEKIEKTKAYLSSTPEELQTLAALERDRETYQGIYDKLVERLGQSEVSSQLEVEGRGVNFRVVDPAVFPKAPVGPNRPAVIVGGIIVGIGVAFGIIFLLDFFNQSFKDVETLKSTLQYEVIAIIPRIVTTKDIKKEKRWNRIVYIPSALYLLVVLSGLVFQVGKTYLKIDLIEIVKGYTGI